MATPAEIVARWDAKQRREVAAKEAIRRAADVANDNRTREPDGYLDMGEGEPPMPYWLGYGSKERETA